MEPTDNVEIFKVKNDTFLYIDNYLWMWDTPTERKAQQSIVDQAFGHVLVAGYGLGVLQGMLEDNEVVKTFHTVEIRNEVMEKCSYYYGKIHGAYSIGDFYKHPIELKYDCVIGDIWEDIVPESLARYKTFKEKAKELLLPGGRILAWGQEFLEYLIDKG